MTIFKSYDEMTPDQQAAHEIGYQAGQQSREEIIGRLTRALEFYASRKDEWSNKEAREALHDVYGMKRA